MSRFEKASTRVFSPLLEKTRTPALYEAEPPKVVKAEKPATVLSWGLAQTRARCPTVVTASYLVLRYSDPAPSAGDP